MQTTQTNIYQALSFYLICSFGLWSCSINTEIVKSPVNSDPDMQTVLNLNPGIRAVSSGGLWIHGEQQGWLRFVVTGGGVEHYRTYLYLQWFTQVDDRSEIKHIATVPVIELNGTYAEPAAITRYTFSAPECKEKTACTEATFAAYDILQDKELQFALLLDSGPGSYRLEIK